jgi:hypothetical protein
VQISLDDHDAAAVHFLEFKHRPRHAPSGSYDNSACTLTSQIVLFETITLHKLTALKTKGRRIIWGIGGSSNRPESMARKRQWNDMAGLASNATAPSSYFQHSGTRHPADSVPQMSVGDRLKEVYREQEKRLIKLMELETKMLTREHAYIKGGSWGSVHEGEFHYCATPKTKIQLCHFNALKLVKLKWKTKDSVKY